MNWEFYEKKVYEFLPERAKKIIQNEAEECVFCRDGIIDGGVFGKAKLNGKSFRPLFVLKEPHDEHGCAGCKELLNGCKNHGVNEATGLHWIDFTKCNFGYKDKIGTTLKLLEFEKIIEEALGVDVNNEEDILNRVSIINLKKMGGGSTTGTEKSVSTLSYSSHAEKFKSELTAQIEEIMPSIIICGGTYGDVYKILDITEKIDTQHQACKVFKSSHLDKDVYVLDMYHPRQRSLKDEVVKEHLHSACEVVRKRLK